MGLWQRSKCLSSILPSQGPTARWPHPASAPNTPLPTLPGWPKETAQLEHARENSEEKKRKSDLDDYLTIPSLFVPSCSDSLFVQPQSCSPSRSNTHISTLAFLSTHTHTHIRTPHSLKVWGFSLSTWRFAGDCGVNEAVLRSRWIWYNFLCLFERAVTHSKQLQMERAGESFN